MSQSPAMAPGVTPPKTQPKKRGPAVATMPGSARASHSSMATAALTPSIGSASSKAAAIASGETPRPTGPVRKGEDELTRGGVRRVHGEGDVFEWVGGVGHLESSWSDW